MQTNNPPLARFFILAPLYLLGVFTTSIFAQDDLEQLNLVLNIEELYEPVASQEIHGETAVSLLEELQTKHYSEINIDDNFSSAAFDSYLDILDGSHLYFLKSDVDYLILENFIIQKIKKTIY